MEATKNTHCPLCGYEFTRPRPGTCKAPAACAKRAAAARSSQPATPPQVRTMLDEIMERAEARTAATRAATPVSTPAEIAEMRREDARIARAEVAEPRRSTPVADWLDRNPADVLDEYVADLKARHAAAVAEGSVIEPALAAQVAEQERQLAWVRARSSK